ncbi:DUF4388 domain-containing protein [Almyronema epifaneia]|uniref:DUF4388 domain-containing protein n=1 Tax=Almyronema epifaneia S1 TaxID=2991925 RepID=A0ABW6ICY5_9CYAN
MTATGYLSEYSLPELLHLLESGSRTGQLSLRSPVAATTQSRDYFVWFRQGRIVSAFNDLQENCLIKLIDQRQLLDSESALKLLQRSPNDRPFGLFLKEKGVLIAEQLQLLFSIQVIRQIRSLFVLEDAWFQFHDSLKLPYREMTGISIAATEVILPGLRALRNWQALQSRFPDAESGLSRCVVQPAVRLKPIEQQVWFCADGETSLQAIAQQLKCALPEVQQVAFCLIHAGLVEEVSLTTLPPIEASMALPLELEAPEATVATAGVSQAFLGSLEQYLQGLN